MINCNYNMNFLRIVINDVLDSNTESKDYLIDL